MNKCILTGHVTRDIAIKYTTTEKAVATFTLAVNRWKKDDLADFILCEAWGQTAETLDRYVKKGHRLGVIGRIRADSYEDSQGQRKYVTKVVVEEIEFLEKKEKKDDQEFQPTGQANLPF